MYSYWCLYKSQEKNYLGFKGVSPLQKSRKIFVWLFASLSSDWILGVYGGPTKTHTTPRTPPRTPAAGPRVNLTNRSHRQHAGPHGCTLARLTKKSRVKFITVDTKSNLTTRLTNERRTQQSNLTAAQIIWPQQKMTQAAQIKHFWPIWPIWPIKTTIWTRFKKYK